MCDSPAAVTTCQSKSSYCVVNGGFEQMLGSDTCKAFRLNKALADFHGSAACSV